MTRRLAAIAVLPLIGLSCSAPPAEPQQPLPGATGGGGAASAGASQGGGGQAGAAQVPTGGTSGAGGAAAGSGGGGAGGQGGNGGTGGGPDMSPFICTPGSAGNGTFMQDGPYEIPPEAQGGIEYGTLHPQQTFESTIYGYGFDYRIYVPDKYDPEVPAALMVFQDGIAHYIIDMSAHVVIDELTQNGDIPVAITLFVNPGQQRSQEYNTPDGKYSQFLLEELIPSVVLSEYNIVDDRDAWLIGGFSSGGIAAITAAWLNTEVFSRVLTHNASIPLAASRGVDYIELVGTTPKKDLRIMLMSNPSDIGGTEPGEWFDTNTRMAEALQLAGYDYRFLIGDATAMHHPPVHPREDLPEALRWIWQGCPVN